MSRIPTAFFISIYGLVALAGLMLAFAEGSPFPQILTPAVAIVAYVLTDRTRTVHLPVLWANALGVAVFVLAGWQMRNQSLEQRVLVASHLLVYLTWIVLFQKKNLTQYWWMCRAGRAAGGCRLDSDDRNLVRRHADRIHVRFDLDAVADFAVRSLPAIRGRRTRRFRRSARHRRPLDRRLADGTQSGRRAGAVAVDASERRAGAFQLNPDERWLGLRYARSILALGMAALVVAAAFFLFIPRLWAGRTEWGKNEHKSDAIGTTGFSNEVRLGDLVPLLENSKRVLQVRLFDSDGNPIDVEEYCAQVGYAEPLFRGTTLEKYEESTWKGNGHLSSAETKSRRRPAAPSANRS